MREHPFATDDFAEAADRFGTGPALFSEFVMAEWHAPEVEARVVAEELAAVPGQVECEGVHGWARQTTEPVGAIEDFSGPCPECGAAV